MGNKTLKDEPAKHNVLQRYKYSGKLQHNKFMNYLFVMIITNLSTFLLVNVDGIIVGNFVGKNALNSVNLLYPFTLVIGAVVSLLAQGASVAISQVVGIGMQEKKKKVYRAIVIMTVIFTVGIAALQFPSAYIMIENYDLSSEMKTLVWRYSEGIFIVNTVGVVSTVCTYLLIATGQGKKLMALSVMEGTVNLLVGLLFVGVFEFGVVGAGFASAIASTSRAVVSLIMVLKSFDIFPLAKVKCGEEAKEILKSGIPSMASSLVIAGQLYAMNNIIVAVCGMDGITARSVALLVNSIATILMNSVTQATNPLLGIATGSEDWQSTRYLVRQSLVTGGIMMFACTMVTSLFPEELFHIYGIDEFTEFEIYAVQIFGLQFIFKGLNTIIRNDFIFLHKKVLATISTILEMSVFLIPSALILGEIGKEALFFSYTVAAGAVTVILGIAYYRTIKAKLLEPPEFDALNISLTSDDAADASRRLQDFLVENDVPDKFANRLSLVVEELSAYVKKEDLSAKNVNVSILFKAYKDRVMVYYLDDGKPIIFDRSKAMEKITTDNYDLVAKLATRISYQNVCGMNNFIMEFIE